VASITKSISIAAKDHVLLTAQGAYLKLAGGNIDVHGPGTMTFKASMKEFVGPLSVPSPGHAFSVSEIHIKRDMEVEYVDADGNVPQNEPIALVFHDGTKKTLTLDEEGKAVIQDAPSGPLSAKQPKRRNEEK
jgi:type VI secretion system secreted protein VgrG